MMRILFPTLMLFLSGCGTATCLSVAQDNPKVQVIYGGVRTDINCIVSGDDYWGKGRSKWPQLHYVPEYIAKPCSVIDLPLSLAADTITLPYAIWLTVRKKKQPQPEERPESTTFRSSDESENFDR